jgi:topoisomerase-4 subunit B
MYIGKLGDGSSSDDGIYVLLKEVLDNSIDEYMMGFGKTIEVIIEERRASPCETTGGAFPWERSRMFAPR